MPPWIPFALFFVIAVVAVLLQKAAGFRVGGRRFATGPEFLSEVARTTGLTAGPVGPGRGLAEVRFGGALASGRLARIFYEPGPYVTKQPNDDGTAHFCVSTDSAILLDVTRENVFERLSSYFGYAQDVHVGDESFDKKFWVLTQNEGRTKRAMGSGLAKIIERLFKVYGIARLRIENGWLQVVARPGDVDPLAYHALLEWLDRAAATFDRVTLPVKVLGGERKALGDGKGGTRCAYCHGGIDGGEPDLIACEQCHTVLHDECWREHGRCPLLGCVGKSPERARTS